MFSLFILFLFKKQTKNMSFCFTACWGFPWHSVQHARVCSHVHNWMHQNVCHCNNCGRKETLALDRSAWEGQNGQTALQVSVPGHTQHPQQFCKNMQSKVQPSGAKRKTNLFETFKLVLHYGDTIKWRQSCIGINLPNIGRETLALSCMISEPVRALHIDWSKWTQVNTNL